MGSGRARERVDEFRKGKSQHIHVGWYGRFQEYVKENPTVFNAPNVGYDSRLRNSVQSQRYLFKYTTQDFNDMLKT